MQSKTRVLIAFLLAALLVLMSGLVAAQEDGTTETFDSAELQGWELSPQASVVDGVLKISPDGFAARFGDWNDVTIVTKIKLTGEGEAVVAYNQDDKGRYALFLLPGHLHLEKNQQGTPTNLGDADVPGIQPGSWIDLGIVSSGGEHNIYIGNELVLSASDTEPLTGGIIFFQALAQAVVEIDDVQLSGSEAAGIPVGEGAPGEPAGEEPHPDEGYLEEELPAPLEGQTDTTAAAPQPLTKQGLIEALFASQANRVELATFFINLLLAAVCAYILSLVYIHWGSSLSNRRKFAANFMLMTVTTTFIILVVRSSVALSLGLVGALSIVRFRTAVKEPEELAYLFFAIGLGIGLGDNQRLITFVALAVGILIIALRRLFRKPDADVNLHLTVAGQGDGRVGLEAVTAVLKQHTAKARLLRFDETDRTIEAAFIIEFRDMNDLSQARNALRELSPALEITFMDNKGIW
ncbi:MAG: DUF4956 domain-containing protein [Anaerolineales bacterium]|nr:DUF4956 domain-containing protein [Anaerolineales bacterium]